MLILNSLGVVGELKSRAIWAATTRTSYPPSQEKPTPAQNEPITPEVNTLRGTAAAFTALRRQRRSSGSADLAAVGNHTPEPTCLTQRQGVLAHRCAATTCAALLGARRNSPAQLQPWDWERPPKTCHHHHSRPATTTTTAPAQEPAPLPKWQRQQEPDGCSAGPCTSEHTPSGLFTGKGQGANRLSQHEEGHRDMAAEGMSHCHPNPLTLYVGLLPQAELGLSF